VGDRNRRLVLISGFILVAGPIEEAPGWKRNARRGVQGWVGRALTRQDLLLPPGADRFAW
jgi:hypothetical protein